MAAELLPIDVDAARVPGRVVAIDAAGNHAASATALADLATSAAVTAGDAANAAALAAHAADHANPHAVDKAQVGLGNVPNVDATNRANHTGTQGVATITGLGTAATHDVAEFDAAGAAAGVQANLTAHAGNTANPHAVTKAQVGLSNVPNLDTSTAVSKAHDAVTIGLANGLTIAGQAIGLRTANEVLNGAMTSGDWSKLQGIAPGATANATDLQLRDRATHTGTQSASTISGGTLPANVVPALAYLPTAGGTLTGGLAGTTGVFSGRVIGSQLGVGQTMSWDPGRPDTVAVFQAPAGSGFTRVMALSPNGAVAASLLAYDNGNYTVGPFGGNAYDEHVDVAGTTGTTNFFGTVRFKDSATYGNQKRVKVIIYRDANNASGAGTPNLLEFRNDASDAVFASVDYFGNISTTANVTAAGFLTNGSINCGGVNTGSIACYGGELDVYASGAIYTGFNDSGDDDVWSLDDYAYGNVLRSQGGVTTLGLPTSINASAICIATLPSSYTNVGNGFYTIPLAATIDPGSHFDSTTHVYTVPTTGTYQVVLKVRLADGTTGGQGYGIGCHTSNVDGPWFSWHQTNSAMRQGATNVRIVTLGQGAQLRAYMYADSFAPTVAAAEMDVTLITAS